MKVFFFLMVCFHIKQEADPVATQNGCNVMMMDVSAEKSLFPQEEEHSPKLLVHFCGAVIAF